MGFASVAAREDVELDAACLQQFAEQKNERRLTRAAGGEIADTDDGTPESPHRQNFMVVERAAHGND